MASTEDDSTYIPIPHYPPFKLRSSLIDKDPVIWVHLLEAYIQLFKYLLNPDIHSQKLSVKSQQQLQLFLKIFLFETSEETTKIFSLGAINPDIKTNTSILRTCVFQLIKNYSFVKLALPGEAIWNFITIYVKDNSTIVRGLVDGTYKSKFNDNKKSGNISCISQVHKHLESLISNGKIQDQELNTLSFLLGQHASSATKLKTYTVTGTSSNNSRNINKKLTSSLAFAEAFVNAEWIEMLERLYVNGKSVHAELIKEIMIISLISLSTAKLAKLAMDLGVNNTDSLVLYPLFSTIIISDAYKELIPGLEERLTFLRNVSFQDNSAIKEEVSIKEEQIELLGDLIPQLTRGQAITILKENNGDVEHVTNILFENPDLISSIKEYEDNNKPRKNKPNSNKTELKQTGGQNLPIAKRSVYDGDKISNLDFSEGSVIYGKKGRPQNNEPTTETMKNKTLTAALRLMYESDEDEPDDTYEEQEKTSGVAADEKNKNAKIKSNKNRLTVFDEEESGTDKEPSKTPERSVSSTPTPASVDAIEKYLFSIFKTKGAEKFDKKDRKSSDRQNIKKSTNWSDEQIEGWLRMLLKSPRRFKLLEEDYLYGGNPNRPTKRNNNGGQDTGSSNLENKPNKSKSKDQVKRSFARNEKNKASKANHNRKAGHNKKTSRELAGMQ